MVPGVRFSARTFRVVPPKWAHDPLSGEGARLHGGRFNPPGQSAFYSALDPHTAYAEYTQNLFDRPGLLCAFDVGGARVRDLCVPETLAALPPPTVGGTNRSDPTPKEDAIIALGGNPQAAGGVPAGDGALVNYAARNGIAADIRTTLASEDLEYRRDNDGRLLERIFNVNVYYRAYADQSLDQQTELARWRRLGARTPSAPPRQDGE